MVQISCAGKWFSTVGSLGTPPWAAIGSKSYFYLGHLSVNTSFRFNYKWLTLRQANLI